MSERCPHCGSEDYGPVNEGHEHACLSCGYDTEHGTTGVCPGGLHFHVGKRVCCDACWKRAPRNLGPADPRWRSRLRWYRQQARVAEHRITRESAAREADRIEEALLTWLREHPVDRPTAR